MRANVARIRAQVVKGHTAITNITHGVGTRLYPAIRSHRAAACSVGGSRLKGGEMKDIDVAVGTDAALSITSNGLRLVPKTVVQKRRGRPEHETMYAEAVQNMS